MLALKRIEEALARARALNPLRISTHPIRVITIVEGVSARPMSGSPGLINNKAPHGLLIPLYLIDHMLSLLKLLFEALA
jgi:hypothetical protein